MFDWPMEEEAKLEFSITVNWRREDGSVATTQLGTLDRGAFLIFSQLFGMQSPV
jgi:hypothetical protein